LVQIIKRIIRIINLHRKKRFTSFPSPAGMSLTKLPLGRNNSVMTLLFPPRESLVVTSRLRTGNSRTFFLRCSSCSTCYSIFGHQEWGGGEVGRVVARTRETREGWPLLNVETEATGDSKSTNERGSSLVGSSGSSCRYKRFCPALGCSSWPRQKIFFPHPYSISIHLSPSPSKLGWQSYLVACLLNVRLWL
jgi:hypothetical protein